MVERCVLGASALLSLARFHVIFVLFKGRGMSLSKEGKKGEKGGREGMDGIWITS